jgi:hypothetical protein
VISIYHSAFNLNKHGFTRWQDCLSKSCLFADEVIVAINTSEDDTEDTVNNILKKEAKSFKVIKTSFDYNDPWLDGKIKNAALQECTQEFKLQLDLDEYVPTWQRSIWDNICFKLKFDSNISCLAIPSVDLYKDLHHFKSINHKQYLHKGIAYRAPQIAARKQDGTINTLMSDGCDLVDFNGNFIPTQGINNSLEALESNQIPFVVHLGYVDLNSRLKRNHEFWHDHWYTEGGGQAPAHKIHMKNEDFEYPYLKHNLSL